MVSVSHSVAAQSDFDQFLTVLSEGLSEVEKSSLKNAVEYAWEAYGNKTLGSGERIWSHALGMAVIVAGLLMFATGSLVAAIAQDVVGVLIGPLLGLDWRESIWPA